MQISGIGIGRVFTQPVAAPRKFHGAIDAALTLALGSVCAFALTLGPAPLNTVAPSSAAASSFAGYLDPSQGSAVLPAEVDNSDGSNGSTSTGEQQGDSVALDGETSAVSPSQAARESSKYANSPGAARKAEKRQSKVPVPPPHASVSGPPPHATAPAPPPHAQVPVPPHGVTGAVALEIVETFRVVSGLSAFVSADACAQPVAHSTVAIVANGLLAAAQAKTTLAPDPARAMATSGPGTLSVTVYTCE